MSCEQIPAVLTIEDLAAYLQISKSTLYKLAQEGALPGLKVGRNRRFHPAAIDRWLGEPLPLAGHNITMPPRAINSEE